MPLKIANSFRTYKLAPVMHRLNWFHIFFVVVYFYRSSNAISSTSTLLWIPHWNCALHLHSIDSRTPQLIQLIRFSTASKPISVVFQFPVLRLNYFFCHANSGSCRPAYSTISKIARRKFPKFVQNVTTIELRREQ